jgi:hypothetical protein
VLGVAPNFEGVHDASASAAVAIVAAFDEFDEALGRRTPCTTGALGDGAGGELRAVVTVYHASPASAPLPAPETPLSAHGTVPNACGTGPNNPGHSSMESVFH